jgi:hypothetical protein
LIDLGVGTPYPYQNIVVFSAPDAMSDAIP